MNRVLALWVIMTFNILLGCQSNNNKGDASNAQQPTSKANILNVAVDESILSLIQEQVDVYHQSFSESKIVLHPAPEVMAVNSLLTDKAQIGVLTRELSTQENEYFTQRNINPKIFKIGHDGIILVNHSASADTSIQISEIIDLLKGQKKGAATLVFDNVNSSALRFLTELSGLQKPASTSVSAEKNVSDLLERLINDQNSIGVLSLNQYLNAKQTFGEIEKIRILSVQNNVGESKDSLYYKPSQSTLATETYPLRRPIYILNYHPNTVLGIGFSSFLTGDRGQRIVLKSGLLPETMPGRELLIRDKIN